MQNTLVRTFTSDNLALNGLFIEGDKSKSAVILVHGFTSDFYTNVFLQTIQESLKAENMASLAIQMRGTGIHTEFGTKDGDTVWLGSFYERLEDAHIDITAWIEFLKEKGYSNFILIGHSLGTIKSVRYLFEGDYKDLISKLVLLAPFDKNGYLERMAKNNWKEYVKVAERKVLEGKGEEIIPNTFDDYPMSYLTYLSWYKQDDLGCMWDFYRHKDYDYPTLKKISIPTQIIVGEKDDFFFIPDFSDMESTKNVLKNNIKNLKLELIEGSGHSYFGFESKVAELVKQFIKN